MQNYKSHEDLKIKNYSVFWLIKLVYSGFGKYGGNALLLLRMTRT